MMMNVELSANPPKLAARESLAGVTLFAFATECLMFSTSSWYGSGAPFRNGKGESFRRPLLNPISIIYSFYFHV